MNSLRPWLLTLILTLGFSHAVSATASDLRHAVDDCEWIRTSLEQMPSAGGRIVIPQGLFTCSSKIVVKKNNIQLFGSGVGVTVLRMKSGSASPVLVIGDDKLAPDASGDWVPATRVYNVLVRDLTIDGNRANQNPAHECGTHACDGDAMSIRNNGLTIRGASYVTVENVELRSNNSGGLVTEKHSDHLLIRGITSTNNRYDGIAGYQTTESLFDNLDLSRNGAAGISLDLDFASNHFRHVKLESNGDVGIFARDIRGVLFEDFEIIASGNHGIYLAANELDPASCPTDNEFRSARVSSSNGYGFYLGNACQGITLTGATSFVRNRDGCIYAPPGAGLGIAPGVVCQARLGFSGQAPAQ